MATTNTITGQLNRINAAANLIWNKASDMALQLPAGSYWDLISKSDKAITGVNLITGVDSPEAEYKIDSNGGKATYNFGIDAVAQAIWNINSRAYLETNTAGTYISGNQDINAKTEIRIPEVIKYISDYDNWSGSLYFDSIDLSQGFDYTQENISSEYILRYIP